MKRLQEDPKLQRLLMKLNARLAELPPTEEPAPTPPNCEKCQDLGFYKLDVKVGDPRFGKAFKCECRTASDAEKQLARIMNGKAGIPPLYRQWSFESFHALPEAFQQGKEAACRACEIIGNGEPLYVESQEAEYPGVFLYGGNGTLKTTLATCALKARAAAGRPIAWIDTTALMIDIQEAYNAARLAPNEPTVSKIIDTAASVHILLLDEFGDQNRNREISDDRREKLYQIIGTRYTNRLPTIVTSNLTPTGIMDQFGASIHRRLFELCFAVNCTGKNPAKV